MNVIISRVRSTQVVHVGVSVKTRFHITPWRQRSLDKVSTIAEAVWLRRPYGYNCRGRLVTEAVWLREKDREHRQTEADRETERQTESMNK
jgi:hypothetical protein